jgi:hypothetical protein
VEPKESKRQDMTLQHCAGRNVGLGPKAAQVPRGRAPAGGYIAIASQIGLGAGTSQDGRWSSARLDFKTDNFQAGRRILGLR